MKVVEIAKLNNMPLYSINDLKNKLYMLTEGVSQEEQHEILEYLRTTDFCDTDEYDIDDEYIIPEERLNITGHYDEQAFLNHIRATDEDGNFINLPREDI